MICLSREVQEPLYMQIYQQIKKEITDGTHKENDILMGSRKLAEVLHVSRNTVDSAYAQLVAEGYICGRRGVGYIVSKLPELKLPQEKEFPPMPVFKTKRNDTPPVLYDLTNSSYTSDLFPKNLWKRYTLECLEQLESEKKLATFQDKQGEPYLRKSLLPFLKRIRGVRCSEDQIIITCGIQQSLDYICKMLAARGSTVLVEEPGFDKAVSVFCNNGLYTRTVPVDKEGILTAELPEEGDILALYSTPSHQFPTGVTLPIGRRYGLLKWAERNDSYIIEDDFDSEQRYYAKPIPSLQSIDVNNRVIYLGTFSKALSPSVRMGYMILPPQLLKLYTNQFKNYNSTVPLLNQYTIGRLIETGQYERHIRRLNNIFRKRLELFQEELVKINKEIKIHSNGTGQYFLLEIPDQAKQQQLIERALEQGVRVYPTMQFWQEKAACPPNMLFLGFSKIDIKDIPDCVERLKKAWL